MTKTSSHCCVFCGARGKLTKEHILSEWIQGVIPDSGKVGHMVRAGFGDTGLFKKGKLDRPGDHLSQTLKVACKKCNETWMSQIVERAKPHLKKLILGQPCSLTLEASKELAAWATLTTIVHEYAHDETRCVDKSEREYIRENLDPPPNWHVWIARHEGSPKTWIWHHAARVFPSFPLIISKSPNFQTTIIALGNVAFQTISCVEGIFEVGKIPARQPFSTLYPRRSYPAVFANGSASPELGRHLIERIRFDVTNS